MRKRGCERKKVSEVDKDTVKCDHCEVKISNKVEYVRAHLEKCKTRKGNNFEPEHNVGSSMINSSVASNASDLSNELVSAQ